MKRFLLYLLAFVVLVLLAYFTLDRVTANVKKSLLGEVGALIETKTGDIIIQGDSLAVDLRRADTRNTMRDEALRDELRRLQSINASLASELRRIGGDVTSISTAIGNIHFGGQDTLFLPPGSNDFTFPYQDAWIDAMIRRRAETVTFDYRTTFSLHEFDVEVTLPDGVKTHLFNTALVSTATGDTLNVPVKRTVIERRAGGRGFHFNPQLHLRGAGGLGQAWVGAGVSAFSWGYGNYIEGTNFWLLEGAILAGDGGFSVGASPFVYNLGRILPLVKNLGVGPAWIWSDTNSGIGVLIGAAL